MLGVYFYLKELQFFNFLKQLLLVIELIGAIPSLLFVKIK